MVSKRQVHPQRVNAQKGKDGDMSDIQELIDKTAMNFAEGVS